MYAPPTQLRAAVQLASCSSSCTRPHKDAFVSAGAPAVYFIRSRLSVEETKRRERYTFSLKKIRLTNKRHPCSAPSASAACIASPVLEVL